MKKKATSDVERAKRKESVKKRTGCVKRREFLLQRTHKHMQRQRKDWEEILNVGAELQKEKA